jgi:hypothetical protein
MPRYQGHHGSGLSRAIYLPAIRGKLSYEMCMASMALTAPTKLSGRTGIVELVDRTNELPFILMIVSRTEL